MGQQGHGSLWLEWPVGQGRRLLHWLGQWSMESVGWWLWHPRQLPHGDLFIFIDSAVLLEVFRSLILTYKESRTWLWWIRRSCLQKDIPESKVKLSSPVCRIFWGNKVEGGSLGGRVLVVTADEVSYLANHVITTVSVGVLKKRHAEIFTPALKKSYRKALAVRYSLSLSFIHLLSCSLILYTAYKQARKKIRFFHDQVTNLGIADKVQLGWDSAWWGPNPLSLQIIFTESLPAEMVSYLAF